MLLGWVLTFLAAPTYSQDTKEEAVPKDTCILELSLPDGARVNVDGHDYGTKRRLKYSNLKPGQVYSSVLQIAYPGGKEEHTILVEAGRVIRFASGGAATSRPELIVQHGHTSGEMICGALSPDERQLLTGGVDRTAILWDMATGRKLQTYAGHRRPVIEVAFTPDGQRILTTSFDDTVVLWDKATGARLRTFELNSHWFPCSALSPDGRRILTNADHDTAIVWDVETGARLHILHGHSKAIRAVAFSSDGQLMATGSADNTAVLWDAASGTNLRTLRGTGGNETWIDRLEFSPDSRRLATGFWSKKEGRVVLWDVATGEPLQTLRMPFHPRTSGRGSMAFSADGRQLLTNAFCGTILWNLENGQRLATILDFQNFPMPNSVSFTRDGRPIVIGWVERGSLTLNTSIGDVRSRRIIKEFPSTTDSIAVAAFSPDGKTIATATESRDNLTILWDTADAQQRQIRGYRGSFEGRYAKGLRFLMKEMGAAVQGHTAPVTCAAFSPSGRYLVTGSNDATLILWDANTGKQMQTLVGHRGVANLPFVKAVFSSVVNSYLRYAANDVDGLRRDADAIDAEQADKFSPGFVRAVAVSSDGHWVLSGAGDHTAILWEASTGRKLRVFEGHRSDVVSVALSSDCRRVLTGSLDGTVVLWDAQSAEKQLTLDGPRVEPGWSDYITEEHMAKQTPLGCVAMLSAGDTATTKGIAAVNSVTFSPDGRMILASFWDGSLMLWEAESGRHLRTFRSAESAKTPFMPHHPIAFSPEGRCLVSGEANGPVIVWDVATGGEVRQLRGHLAEVTSVSYSPDGGRLLSSSADGTVRIWDLGSGQELLRLVNLRGGADWVAATAEGLFDGSAGGREKVMFRVGGGLNVVPVDRFFQDFYYPGLLAATWRGERPLPKVQMGESLPPRIRIVVPGKGGVIEENRATVEVEVVDQGGGVRGPWLVQNGARVLAAEKTEQKGKTLRRIFDVPLVQGENKLEFHAASADGSWESEPALLTLRYEKPLPKPELYLVSVGVNRYAEESMSLGFAARDAQAMAKLFQQRGPSLYSAVHVTTLVDDEATTAAILDSLRQLAKKAKPQDTVTAFLAGHGAVAGQQYYFLPHEFRRQAKTLEEDVRLRGLSASKIQEVLVAIPALKRVVVFDTGQSGGKMGLARTARDPFAFRGAIERLSRASGAFMIASAAVSDEAQEVSDLKHGVLTYALLAGLHATDGGPLAKQWIEPKNKDRVADVLDWFGFASAYVPQLTKKYFGRQQELQHSSLGTSFPILPVVASGTPSPMASTSAPPPMPRPKTASAVLGSGDARLHVVAVGINQYHEEAMNLKYARNDVESIVKLLRRRGQRLYREVVTAEVLDAQATKEGILNSLEKAAKQAKTADTLVVFFSGHGRMVGQRYYFIPSDFHRQEKTIEEDIQRQGVPADVLADAVSKSPARKRLLIFDTCASGGALSISRQGQKPFAFRGAIDKLGERQGVFTIAASAASQEAQEIDALSHGVLTYALLAGLHAVPPGGPLEGLNVQPNGPEGMVDVLEWFSFASGHVPRLTRQYLDQMQEVQTSAQGASFPLLSTWEQ